MQPRQPMNFNPAITDLLVQSGQNGSMNYGLLQNPNITSIQSAQPQAQPAPIAPAAPTPESSGSAGKGLLSGFADNMKSGLNSIFGTNPVQLANQSLSKVLSNASPDSITKSLFPQTTSSGTNQSVPPQVNGGSLIQQIKTAAQKQFPNNPVMQQIAVSQAAHESGLLDHPSQLATKYNNLYGMKGAGTAGQADLRTNEYIHGRKEKVNAGFAAYKTPEESVDAWSKLMQNPKYQAVMQAKSVEEGANALQKAGYATDPHYAKNLVAN